MADGWWRGASDYERAVLSSLEASLERTSPRLARRFAALGRSQRVPARTWLALIVSWAGAGLVLTTFTASPSLAFVGLALMSGGLAAFFAFEYPRSLAYSGSRPAHIGPGLDEW